MPRDGGYRTAIPFVAHEAGEISLIAQPTPHRHLAWLLTGLWDKRRRLRRLVPVLAELTRAGIADARESHRPESRIRQCYTGRQAPRSGNGLAIYAHYSEAGFVHEMILRQLALYGDAGFDIVFVTMSDRVGEDDIRNLLPLTRLIIHRRSFGRDFGAWRDAADLAVNALGRPGELLLVNDSVLGPLRPIDRLIARMREHGPGLIGLTDSRMGPPHLQSYFLLVEGPAAVAEVLSFLEQLKLSHSEWLMVRRGEFGLTRCMAVHGHAVISMFPYDIVRAIAIDAGDGLPAQYAPMNPTHNAWRVLIENLGFPFIKRDLLTCNPNAVGGVERWPSVLPNDSLIDAATIQSYLLEVSRKEKQKAKYDA
ncbi:MAG TPA: rhamnan synthesis F family protein [Acetobacteraceae bacterium]|nr:rhamnan synthesis F family protein [Acetobacteraceae bacterium]